MLVIAQIVGLVANFQRNTKLDEAAATKEANCKNASDLLLLQLTTLDKTYQSDVYSNPSTDTIYKQILLANQYQFKTELAVARMDVACR